ncbi:MAG: M20/M25/M40 family metallo-hydrolase [Acidobacteriota bacterium]|nr:M20/M25/M40 family metallo-hydrolase [Acidobacteriota bacterium]
MNTLTARRKLYFLFAFFAILLISITSAIFGNLKSFAQSNERTKNKSAETSSLRWLTVDEKEFQHIQNVLQKKGVSFDLKIVERRAGLLVVAADEQQSVELTQNMHEEFQKCGGFISHETPEAARLSLEEGLHADSNLRAVEYTINNPTLVNSLHAEAKEPEIRETITRLSTDFPNRRYNLPSGTDSANWIKNKWTQIAAGRSDISVEFFNHSPNTSPQPSIILTVRGTTLPDEVVVFGAHQDSIHRSGESFAAPGADDDASGIASMTEVIRVLVARNFHPQRTVKFMAYAAEEIGLRGSYDIATNFQARGVNVVGVLQLDMTNYKASSTSDIAIITDYTNAAQNQFLRDLLATYQPTLAVVNSACNYGCSDHASWYQKGYPASFPFEAPFPANPYIHTTNDTIAQSGGNADHALKFTKLALSYLGELAKETIGISGTVAYGITPANQTQKFVLGVLASVNSASPATTDSAGFYLIKNLMPNGSYSVTLSKTGNENGITAFDAVLALRHVAANGEGTINLTPNQQTAADTDKSGTITAFDATQILRYVAANGQSNLTGAAGQWNFTPPSRSYSAFSGFDADENYTAVLVGDVDGSWTP